MSMFQKNWPDHEYSVASIKEFMGIDCRGFNCSLRFRGKKIADAINDGSGGPTFIRWGRGKRELYEDKLSEFVKTIPSMPSLIKGHGDIEVDTEFFISLLFEAAAELKEFTRIIRRGNRTAFRLKGDKPLTYRVMAAPFNSMVAKRLRQNYGNKLEDVLNENSRLVKFLEKKPK